MSAIRSNLRLAATCLVALALTATAVSAQTDPLPSSNEGAAKQAIVDFVTRTTTEGSAEFGPPKERIAASDQDGTLWVEHQIYTEFQFVMDRVPELVKAHPKLADKLAFAAILSKDQKRIAALDARELFGVLVETLSGMTPEELGEEVNCWLKTARDPRWHRPFIGLTYLPMQEVLTYLRANGYKTFIATGGSVGVVAPYSEEFYGIPPEQVSGSAQPMKFEIKDGNPVPVREANLALNNV